jgi:hypothetical protein
VQVAASNPPVQDSAVIKRRFAERIRWPNRSARLSRDSFMSWIDLHARTARLLGFPMKIKMVKVIVTMLLFCMGLPS